MDQGKGYFEFTRRERTGIIALVMLILIMAFMPAFFPEKRPDAESLSFETLSVKLKKAPANSYGKAPASSPAAGKAEPAELFEFDPNTLNAAGWKKLGLHERPVLTIQHFIEKGGRFRQPEDLRRIYGLVASDCERLIPYIRIRATRTGEHSWASGQSKKPIPPHKTYSAGKPFTAAKVEINTADSSAFIALPGIGSILAERIIRFRERLGGFHSVEQMKEVYGLPDSTYAKIADRLTCDASLIKKIGVNDADAALLKQHPYIRWNIANSLVNYRQQHGPFASFDDLSKITSIESHALTRLLPYLTIAPDPDKPEP